MASNENSKENPCGVAFRLVFLETPKSEQLKQFYNESLGLPIRKQFGGAWCEMGGPNGASLAVHQVDDEEDCRLYLSFEVDQLDDLRARLIAAKIECSQINERSRGRFFTCRDPVGTRLHFISFKQEWRAASQY